MESPSALTPPDYAGGSLVNLMAELEWRLTGSALSPLLQADLADQIPSADTYVLILIDGLGAAQLDHPAAGSLAGASRATFDAPFPTTTTVSLASVSTGHVPLTHGLLGHIIWIPELEAVANSLKWIAPGGAPIDIDTSSYLPSPNLWERLRAGGVEPITVQPGQFDHTPLSEALYRGCRFEPVWDTAEFANAVVELSSVSNRLIFAYLPEVDFAAHLFGQQSDEYSAAVRTVASAWDSISARLRPNVAMVGTADHGHIDYTETDKFFITRDIARAVRLFGDPRALYVKGPEDAISALGEVLPATWFSQEEIMTWWGPETTSDAAILDRMPDGVFMADPGRVLIPGHMDKRLIGYHGGLDPRELKIPLLIAEPL